MMDDGQEPSEAEVSTLDGGMSYNYMTPEQAVEARIAAARDACTSSSENDFYAGDAGTRARSIPKEQKQPVKLGYSQPNSQTAAAVCTPVHAMQPSIHTTQPVTPHDVDDIDALKARNTALQTQVESLRLSQGEATAAVLAAQHRHEANLVKLREKQAKQAATLNEKDQKLAQLMAQVEDLKHSNRQHDVNEVTQRNMAVKLREKESMIAKMRLVLEKQANEKKTMESYQNEKTRQFKELLAKVDAAARQQKSPSDQEVEAILSEVTLETLPPEAIKCVDRLTTLVFQTKAEVKRLRVQLAARSNSPSAPDRTGSPATRERRVERMGVPSRTSSPAQSQPTRPNSRIIVREAPKGEEAWKMWNEKKKRGTTTSDHPAPVQHGMPWKGGGLAKRPTRAPSPSAPGSKVSQAERPVRDENGKPQPTVTTFSEQQQQRTSSPSTYRPQQEKKEVQERPAAPVPHGLLALVGNSRGPTTPRTSTPPVDNSTLTYGNQYVPE
eukprot:TRINITY_DN5945_c0_g1_i1.p1 TRINITY_DN5945_c0_g1~~TRINITY_DN5945_c0_g1_i1.p1  ORF type:complete len:497 (+),score=155.82 TRINITY_DN5945_c0_g1_i1:511-2001(+)